MKISIYFALSVTLIFMVTLTACKQKSIFLQTLAQAENLMEEKPDSALIVLEQLDLSQKGTDEEYALWCLLTTQAWDKNYMRFPSDSLIENAITFYEKKQNPKRLMQSLYYKAVYLHDIGDALQAQDYYLKALEYAELLQNVHMIARISANLGTLYTYLNMLDLAIEFQKKSLTAFEELTDTINMSRVLRNKGRIYYMKRHIEDAIICYQKALSMTTKEHQLPLMNELSYLYLKLKKYEQSYLYIERSLAQLAVSNYTFEDSCKIFLTKGVYFEKMNQRDSALYYLNISKKASRAFTVAGSYESLANLDYKNKNWEGYAFYKKKHEALKDSLDTKKQDEQLAHIQGLYDYRNIEKKKELLEQEVNLRKTKTYKLYILIVFCISLSMVLSLIEMYQRKEIVNKKDKALRYNEQEYRQSLQYLKDREETISKLEKMISSGQKDLSNAQKQLLIAQRRLLEAEKENEMLLVKKRSFDLNFYNSEFYTRLYSNDIKLKDDDWEEIAAWLDVMHSEFTHRVKVLHPAISITELRICYLVKIKIPVRQIALLLNMTSQAISQNRKRLHVKITGKAGSAKDFDSFIADF